MGSYTPLRAFLAIIVVQSVVGLLAFPLFASNTLLYILAFINNIAFGIGALYLGIHVRTLLPRWRSMIVAVVWIQFFFLMLVGIYELWLESPTLSSDLLFGEIIGLLIATGIWYCVASGIAENVNKHASGTYKHEPMETVIAAGLLIISILIVALGFIGLSS